MTIRTTTPGHLLQVFAYSTTASGLDTDTTDNIIFIQGMEPAVTSAEYPMNGEGGGPGIPGTFHFDSPMRAVVAYRYTWESGEELVVAAGEDGTATVTLTPTTAGRHGFRVAAVNADGVMSGYTFYDFTVRPPVEGR